MTHIGEEIVSQSDELLMHAQAEIISGLNYQEQVKLAELIEKSIVSYKKSI